AIVDGDHDSGGRQRSFAKAPRSLREGQHLEAKLLQQAHSPLKGRRRHERAGIPHMLVGERSTVVTEDSQRRTRKKPGDVEAARSLEQIQTEKLEFSDHGRSSFKNCFGRPVARPGAAAILRDFCAFGASDGNVRWTW